MWKMRTIVLSSLALSAFLFPLLTDAAETLKVEELPILFSGSIPQGAQRVPFVTLRVRAGDAEPTKITAITVRHEGLGSVQDISRVYAMQGIVRISRGISLPEAKEQRIPLRQFLIPAGKTVDIGIFADLAADAAAGGEHRIDVISIETADGEIHALTNVPSVDRSARVTSHTKQPLVTAIFRPLLTDVTYGSRRIVARMLLSGSPTTDQKILSITLTNDGSAGNSDLQNLYLETSAGEVVSTVLPSMDGSSVRLLLDPPFVLGRGNEKFFQLRADVRASKRRTIRFILEEPSDIQAVEVRGR